MFDMYMHVQYIKSTTYVTKIHLHFFFSFVANTNNCKRMINVLSIFVKNCPKSPVPYMQKLVIYCTQKSCTCLNSFP